MGRAPVRVWLWVDRAWPLHALGVVPATRRPAVRNGTGTATRSCAFPRRKECVLRLVLLQGGGCPAARCRLARPPGPGCRQGLHVPVRPLAGLQPERFALGGILLVRHVL